MHPVPSSICVFTLRKEKESTDWEGTWWLTELKFEISLVGFSKQGPLPEEKAALELTPCTVSSTSEPL